MRLSNHTARTVRRILDQYSDSELSFTKTVVPVRLARYGHEQLVSRSQAKRLLARVDRFKTVMFDFKDVNDVGPAFADEIFRVFALGHPEIELIELNASARVGLMIQRARKADLAPPPST